MRFNAVSGILVMLTLEVYRYLYRTGFHIVDESGVPPLLVVLIAFVLMLIYAFPHLD